MKKKICSLALLATAGMGSMFMTACGDPALESISVKDGSIETTLLVGSDTPDWRDLVLNLTYENDEKATATKNDDMTISEIDTSILGTQELVIKYKGLTTKVKIHIVAHEGDLYEYVGYQKPDSYTLYEGNKNLATPDATTFETESKFYVGGKTYKVGDDNPFIFLPKIKATNQQGNTVTVTEYTSDVVVKEIKTVGGNTVVEELTGSDLEAVVAIDNVHSSFDFTEAAIGRTFEITVKPLNYDETMPYDPITFTVDVVNAWNAYTVADLSRIENNAGTASLWAAKKAELGIDTNTQIDSIVLHNDMEITRDDLPDTMFHPANTIHDSQDISGSLIDSMSFYTRDTHDATEPFVIYGNYFTIKTRNEGEGAIPMVEYLSRDNKFGHAAIFSFGGDNNGSPNHQQGDVIIDSLSLKGNGSREGGSNPHNHRGLIGILTTAQNMTIENCLTRAFTSHVIAGGDCNYSGLENITCSINNSKMIDSFQAMMLAWRSKNNNINNSVMKDSGGPLIIATHVDAENGGHKYSNITINDSILESVIGGEEAWFVKNSATGIISMFRALNEMIKGYSAAAISQDIGVTQITSFENALNQFNFYAVNMEDDNIFNKTPVEGVVTIKENGIIKTQQDMANDVMTALCGAGYISGTVGGYDIVEGEDEPVESPAAAPVFECGGTFVTLDLLAALGGGDPMTGLNLVLYDDTLEAVAGTKLVLISLSNWKESDLYKYGSEDIKQLIEEKIANFFNGNYVNVYLGGRSLGSTFEMFHLDPSQA